MDTEKGVCCKDFLSDKQIAHYFIYEVVRYIFQVYDNIVKFSLLPFGIFFLCVLISLFN